MYYVFKDEINSDPDHNHLFLFYKSFLNKAKEKIMIFIPFIFLFQLAFAQMTEFGYEFKGSCKQIQKDLKIHPFNYGAFGKFPVGTKVNFLAECEYLDPNPRDDAQHSCLIQIRDESIGKDFIGNVYSVYFPLRPQPNTPVGFGHFQSKVKFHDGMRYQPSFEIKNNSNLLQFISIEKEIHDSRWSSVKWNLLLLEWNKETGLLTLNRGFLDGSRISKPSLDSFLPVLRKVEPFNYDLKCVPFRTR